MIRIPRCLTRAALIAWLARHPPAVFVLMGASFIGFALCSVDVVMLLERNIEFLRDNGWLAVQEGALLQLAELLAIGYLALAFYVGFKACEKMMVEAVVGKK